MGHNQKNERRYTKLNQDIRKGGVGQHNWGKPGEEMSNIEATRAAKSMQHRKHLV